MMDLRRYILMLAVSALLLGFVVTTASAQSVNGFAFVSDDLGARNLAVAVAPNLQGYNSG